MEYSNKIHMVRHGLMNPRNFEVYPTLTIDNYDKINEASKVYVFHSVGKLPSRPSEAIAWPAAIRSRSRGEAMGSDEGASSEVP